MRNTTSLNSAKHLIAVAAVTVMFSVASTAAIVLWTPTSNGIPDIALALVHPV